MRHGAKINMNKMTLQSSADIGKVESLTCGSMAGAKGWMTSWTGSEEDEGGFFLFWRPLPGGLGITPVPEPEYNPWLSVSWYSAACLASASFLPTTNLGSGRSLTGKKRIHSQHYRKLQRFGTYWYQMLQGTKVGIQSWLVVRISSHSQIWCS